MIRRRAAVIWLAVLGIAACSPSPVNKDEIATGPVKKLTQGEQVTVKSRWIHICCDCLLVHEVEMVFDEETGLYKMRWWRNDQRTKRLRDEWLKNFEYRPPERQLLEPQRDIRVE